MSDNDAGAGEQLEAVRQALRLSETVNRLDALRDLLSDVVMSGMLDVDATRETWIQVRMLAVELESVFAQDIREEAARRMAPPVESDEEIPF